MSNYDPYRATAGNYPVSPGGRGMEYGRLLTFIFESPNWMMNLVWSALCMLLSGIVVGQLVMHGYQAQIMIASVINPNAIYPDFDSNKIGDYLIRGLWMWLATLIISFVLGFFAVIFVIFFLFVAGVLIGIASPNGQEPNALAAIVVFIGYFSLIIGLSVLSFVCVVPAVLKVALTGNLAEMFDIGWHLDFIRRMFGSMILGIIVIMLISMLLTFGGLLLCLIGLIPAMGWLMLSQSQLYAQLYRTYLERGGRQVPIQPLVANF